jgi:branched-chain amino acid transport system ATP-binding protein
VTLLEVSDLSKRFGQLTVVEGLSFRVASGEALGIVGPNGAGKTTLLNLIAGDFMPDHGTVVLQGTDVTREAAHRRCRRGIGRTSQIPRPFEGLTVFENVLVGSTFGAGGEGGAASGRASSATAHAVDALERTGMLHRANVAAGSLTLLERKRLELSRALVETIRAIRADGVAIVWIEHIVHALLSVVDRILAIDAGRKLIEGDPHEVMASDVVRSVYLGELQTS